MSKQQDIGCGFIGISEALYPRLGSPQTPEQWYKALLLPDDFVIERVEHVAERGLYHVFVQSASIPPFGDYEPMPRVVLHYMRHEDGSNTLTRIEVWHWDGEHWVKAN